jgi:hypothetical protein
MIDGLWIVRYHGPKGVGAGTVVFTKGQVLGGDNGFTYNGTFELKDSAFKAKVSVKNFDVAIPNVLGVPGNFDLLLEGKILGDKIEGTGALATHPEAKIIVRLEKVVGLS